MARAKATRSETSRALASSSASSGAALTAAVERLESGELEPALASLLEAWRETGAARIADAIDRLSERITANEPPITPVGGTSAKTAWYAAAKAQRPAALGRLLEAVPDGLDRVKRLEALLAWPPDPRVASQARTWIETPPVKGKNRPGFFNALWKLIEHTRDTRLSPVVTEISASRASAINRYGLRAWVPLTELAERFEQTAPAALGDAATTLMNRIDALLEAAPKRADAGTSADEAELYERIYADPSDDEPRAVLADLLQQRGDPRGELIALQLARHGTNEPASPAERKLLQKWGRTWLGPLDEVLLKDGVEYERGFVARCRYEGEGPMQPSFGAKEWSTVTHLDVSHASRYVGGSGRLLATPALRNVRHVTGLSNEDQPILAAAETRLPWLTVGWRTWNVVSHGAGELFAAAKTLIVQHAESRPLNMPAPAIVALLEQWPNVDTFEIDALTAHVGPIRAAARGMALKRLVITDRPLRVELEGDQLTVTLRYYVEDTVTEIVRLMRELEPKRLIVRPEKKGVLAGDQLTVKYAKVSLKPIFDAAKAARIEIEVRGTVAE